MHLDNIEQFLGLLVDGGTTVICVEHHQAVVAHSDYVIDIGPGTGHDGGPLIDRLEDLLFDFLPTSNESRMYSEVVVGMLA